MQDYQTNPAGQLRSGNPFTVINNVRDQCQQPADKKFLLLTLATYCDGKGICWPSNRALMRATGKSERTIQRTLKALERDGEFKVLTPGGGHQRRAVQLHRYAVTKEKGVTAMTGGVVSRSLGEMSLNNHSEQPVQEKEKHSKESTHHLLRKVVRSPYCFEGEDSLLEEQANALRFYNKKLRRRGWRPVRKVSPEVEKVLEIFEAETIIELVEGVLAGSPDVYIPDRRTLVRLCWENY